MNRWLLSSIQESPLRISTRPDLGRKLNEATRQAFAGQLKKGAKVTLMVGDGLSSQAMVNIPDIIPAIQQGLRGFGAKVDAFL